MAFDNFEDRDWSPSILHSTPWILMFNTNSTGPIISPECAWALSVSIDWIADMAPPQLPEDLEDLNEEDREQELELHRRRHPHFYYVGATARKNDQNFQALMHPAGLFCKKIFSAHR